MKQLFLMVGATLALLGATPEQVERYLMVSGSEDQLMAFEEMVDEMGQMFGRKSGTEIPLMQDSQLVSIRFREYIQQHLSDSEMEEVLANYAHDVMRKLVSAEVIMDEQTTRQEYIDFQQTLQTDPLPKNRTEAVRAIVEALYDEEALSGFFTKLFLPTYTAISDASGQPIDAKQIEKVTKDFVKRMRDQNYNAMLFMTRDFTDEELGELEEIAKSSASDHEVKAVFGGIEYAMEEAMLNMARELKTLFKARRHPPMRGKDAASEKGAVTPAAGAPRTAPARSAE